MPSHLEQHSATLVPFLTVLFPNLRLLVCDVDTERRGATRAPQAIACIRERGSRCSTWHSDSLTALNVSVFSLPETYGVVELFALSLRAGISS